MQLSAIFITFWVKADQAKKLMPFLSKKIASDIILSLSALLILFHLLVVLGFVPQEIIWGGKIEVTKDLVILESISIAVVTFMFILMLAYKRLIALNFGRKTYRFFFWLYCILFALNTLGNLAAETSTETLLFTPLTLLLCIAFFRLTREN